MKSEVSITNKQCRLDALHTLVCSLLCQGYMLRVEQDLKWKDYQGSIEAEIGDCYRHINSMKSVRVWIFPPNPDDFEEAIYSVLVGSHGTECWNVCWYGPTDEFCMNRLIDYKAIAGMPTIEGDSNG